jgi:hypothetical protein
MFYALMLDTNGNGIGSNKYYQNQEPSYPSNEFPCTEAQAQNPTAYQVVNGKIVESLSYAKTSQIAVLQSAFQQAEQAPVSLTLASGVTTSFGMSPHDWTKIVGLYSKYVVKGDPIPSNYPLPDVNMVLRTVTKTDIDNLFEAGKSQIDNVVSKLASLLESVNTATTVEAVKSITW